MITCYNLENEGTVDIDHTTLDEIDSIDFFVYPEGKTKEKCLKCGFTGHVHCGKILTKRSLAMRQSSTANPPPPNSHLTIRHRGWLVTTQGADFSKVWPTAVLTILLYSTSSLTRRWSFE